LSQQTQEAKKASARIAVYSTTELNMMCYFGAIYNVRKNKTEKKEKANSSAIIIQMFSLRQSQGVIHTADEMTHASTDLDNATLLHHLENPATTTREPAEKHTYASINIRLDNTAQNLCTRAVDTGDAVNVKDDILIVLWRPNAGEGWMSCICAV